MKDMDEKFFLCVEIGGTNLRYGVVTKDYTLKQFDKIPSQGLSDARDKGEYLKQLLDPVLEENGGVSNFMCISLSFASLMNRDLDHMLQFPKYPGL